MFRAQRLYLKRIAVRLGVVVCAASLALPGATAQADAFTGRVVIELLDTIDDFHKFRLLEEFGYLDPRGRLWLAQKNGIVDDSPVPEALQGLAMLPQVADYRKAAIMHSYFSRVRSEPWRNVHRMLYDAAVAEGLDPIHARVVYAAVRAGGWRWELRDSSCFRSCHAAVGQLAWKPIVEPADIEPILAWVLAQAPDLDAIDSRVDAVVRRPGPHLFAQPR